MAKEQIESVKPINIGFNQMGFYIQSIYEQLAYAWLKMSPIERRLAAGFIKNRDYRGLEVFTELMVRHGGSMDNIEVKG